jgi:hypothetical protein
VIARDSIKFNASVLRNPVIDIATMSASTDIPDWCHVEANSTYMQNTCLFLFFWRCSI